MNMQSNILIFRVFAFQTCQKFAKLVWMIASIVEPNGRKRCNGAAGTALCVSFGASKNGTTIQTAGQLEDSWEQENRWEKDLKTVGTAFSLNFCKKPTNPEKQPSKEPRTAPFLANPWSIRDSNIPSSLNFTLQRCSYCNICNVHHLCSASQQLLQCPSSPPCQFWRSHEGVIALKS